MIAPSSVVEMRPLIERAITPKPGRINKDISLQIQPLDKRHKDDLRPKTPHGYNTALSLKEYEKQNTMISKRQVGRRMSYTT